jgi:transaldolase
MPYRQTKVFLDSADPRDTQKILGLLGFLDGQTTNPSLITKILGEGEKISETALLEFYKKNIQEISGMIPEGSVSIEVYADEDTTSEEVYAQAVEMNTWIPNAHVKFPTIPSALQAAEQFLTEGGRANFTLVFSQDQAAAIHSLATQVGATPGQIYISPFIGRLDDIGDNGMDLIKNIQKMYAESQSPVELLAASLRNLDHLKACLDLEVDIMTLPIKLIEEWQSTDLGKYALTDKNLSPINYKTLDLTKPWNSFELSHPLTTKGLAKFAEDWIKNLV